MKSIKLIVAVDKYFGFSKNNSIPWHYSNDFKHFKETTVNTCVIMGKNTYLNIGKPLNNRINIVISSTLDINDLYPNLFVFKNLLDGINYAQDNFDKDIYICGGFNIYNEALSLNIVDTIIITYINKVFDCDLFLPINYLWNFKNDFNKKLEDDLTVFYLSKKIESLFINFPIHYSNEFEYLNNLNYILNYGSLVETRNGTCLSIFSPPEMRFNLLNGFPLLTTKSMYWKGIVLELIMFINGITDSTYLSSKGVKIWDGNTTREFLDSRNLKYDVGDMGPMYGWNWRHFGADYINKDTDYTNKGFDQLNYLIETIKKDPHSRRLLLTTFDPSKVSQAVLPPCHSLPIQFYINDKYIDCKMTQRSADMFLGVPFNIASTSLFLTLIGNLTGYIPRYVILSLGDAHIYKDHLEQCKLQLSRAPYDMPEIKINVKLNDLKDLETLKYNDISLLNYKSHPGIKAQMIA